MDSKKARELEATQMSERGVEKKNSNERASSHSTTRLLRFIVQIQKTVKILHFFCPRERHKASMLNAKLKSDVNILLYDELSYHFALKMKQSTQFLQNDDTYQAYSYHLLHIAMFHSRST